MDTLNSEINTGVDVGTHGWCACVWPMDARESQSVNPLHNLGAGVDGGSDFGAGVGTGDKFWNLAALFRLLCGVVCWLAPFSIAC